MKFQIVHSEIADLKFIFKLFNDSIVYQEKRGYPVWRNYDQNSITNDVMNKLSYKIVSGSTIAIAFSVCYSDKAIWRELEKGDSIYLHRIVVNPDFKGQKLFGLILNWALEDCKHKGLKYVRLDTWANNPTIISYYQSFGFRFVENYTTNTNEHLPAHTRNLALALFEYDA